MILIATDSLSDLYSRLRPVVDQAALRDASRVEAPTAAAAGSDNAPATIVKTSHGETTATASSDVAAYLSLGRRSARTGQSHLHLHLVDGPRVEAPLSSDPREAQFERIAQTNADYEARQQRALQDRIINGDANPNPSTGATDSSGSDGSTGSNDATSASGDASADASTSAADSTTTAGATSLPARALRAYSSTSTTSASLPGHQLALAA